MSPWTYYEAPAARAPRYTMPTETRSQKEGRLKHALLDADMRGDNKRKSELIEELNRLVNNR